MGGCWNDSRVHRDGRPNPVMADMDQAAKIKHREEVLRQLDRKSKRVNSSKARGVVPVNRKPQPGNMTSLDGQGGSCDEVQAHDPRVFQLNHKPSLMGVHIYDEEDQFFSRQSSMSSIISEKFRSGMACLSCRGEGEQGHSIDPSEKNRGMSVMSHAGKREQNSTPLGENDNCLERNDTASQFENSKAASGMLYPSPHVGSSANSSILNAVHFTFGDVTTTGTSQVTDKIYKHLLGKSRLQKCSDGGGVEMMQKCSRNNQQTQGSSGAAAKTDKYSPVSSHDPQHSRPTSLTFSERLFGYEFSKDPPQRQSQCDERSVPIKQTGPNAWHLNSHLGRCSMMIPAMSDYEDTDDDDIIIEDDIVVEIPTEIALHCFREHRHHAEHATVGARQRPSLERWSTNRKSFNLNLEQIPVKTLSINMNGSRQHQSSDPGRYVKSRAKLDVSQRELSSLNSSFNGESRRLKKGTLSSFTSERSGWLEFESEMNDFVLNSGRLKLDIKYDPNLDQPNLEQVNKGLNKLQDDQGKMDEEDFPFNSPIASSFVFGESGKKCSKDAHQELLTTGLSSMPRTLLSGTEDSEDLDQYDAYHNPDDIDGNDGSISDTDSSLTTFSLEADSAGGLIDLPSQWVSTRSFNYVRDVVDHNSGYLDIECRSGRFSVDLRRDKRLDKAVHPPSPDMRLSIMKNENPSSRRSLLSPCLPFRHKQRNLSRLQQPSLAASRRLSISARLDPVDETAPKLQPYNSFTAPLGDVTADSAATRLQAVNSFIARLGQFTESASNLQAIDSFTARLGP